MQSEFLFATFFNLGINMLYTILALILGVVAPTPIRCAAAEQIVNGQVPSEELLRSAAQACADASKPIDDFRASADYRKEILKVLFERAFAEAYEQATDTGA